MSAEVEYLDAEPNGLASMLGGLIEGNLKAHPEREALLSKGATYSIVAPDVGVAVSLRFSPGKVQVRNDEVAKPNVRVETDSETLIGLSSVPLRFGLPDVLTADGRAVTRKLLSGKLKVRGLFRHLLTLTRLQRLLSVV